MSKRNLKQIYFFVPFATLVSLVGILLFLFINGGYSKCIDINLQTCLASKQYKSKINSFTFRYPSDYPISTADEASLLAENNSHALIGSGEILYETLNFSKEYYLNAGGDRLAILTVEKNNLSNVSKYMQKEVDDYNKLSVAWKKEFEIQKPEFERLTISGEEAVTLKSIQGPHSFTSPEIKYVFFHGGRMYSLSFYYNPFYHKMSAGYYDQGRRIILSTFNFNK